MLIYQNTLWEKAIAEASKNPADLERSATASLSAPFLSVTAKKHPLPPGAVLNDYVSIAPYWWPDPDRADGLPWIRRDGEVNPVFFEYDSEVLLQFCRDTIGLLLGAEVLKKPEMGERAAQNIRHWFLEPASKMNPHLSYAQFVPGRNTGRNFGIIDTIEFIYLFELVERLEFNRHWTETDLAGLKEWTRDYLDWLLTSELGRQECATRNNHADWYDAQIVAFSLFAGKPEIARRQLLEYTVPRLETQLAPDGSLPFELERTLSKHYTVGTLYCFALLAYMAQNCFGIDLWNRSNLHGVSLRQSMAWVDRQLDSKEPWAWQQIRPFGFQEPARLYFLAGILENNPEYRRKADERIACPLEYLIQIRQPQNLKG